MPEGRGGGSQGLPSMVFNCSYDLYMHHFFAFLFFHLCMGCLWSVLGSAEEPLSAVLNRCLWGSGPDSRT